MNIAIYTPYLDTFGGGERYILTVAEVLSKKHNVELLLDDHLLSLGGEILIKRISKHLNLDLNFLKVKPAPMFSKNSLNKLVFLKKYDLLIYVTDGSFFYSTAKRNIMHIQSPLRPERNKSLISKLKLKSWDLIIYNSEFTQKNCSSFWPVKGVVLYPPVDTTAIVPLKKKKIILTVGRFFSYLKEKKHEVMIDAFKNLYDSGKIEDWKFMLAGSASEKDLNYIEQLKERSKGYPIYMYPNIAYQDLVKLYGESSIYWHAMGFKEKDPTKMEHFGITTVEAMSAGCVPIVIRKGGQTEIIQEGKTGLLWDDIKELLLKTLTVIQDKNLRNDLSQKACKRSKIFSKLKFQQQVEALI